MTIPYLVRKKANLTSGHREERWYAVQKKLQERGGVDLRKLSDLLSKQSNFPQGMIMGVLSELGETIEDILSNGQSVTIPGLGTFQTALTSPGFETPEQVTPGKVKLTRVYFKADRKMTARLKKEPRYRIPFNLYFPESSITPAMRKADGQQAKAEEEGE